MLAENNAPAAERVPRSPVGPATHVGRGQPGLPGRATLAVLAILLASLAGAPARAESPFRLIDLDGFVMKWGEARLGRAAAVTYAFATGRMNSPEARNCRGMTRMDGLLARSRITRRAFRREVAAAFAMWAAAANISFRRIDDSRAADIVIGAQTRPRGRAYANVDFDGVPGTRVGVLQRSLICLNPRRRWKIGFDGDLDRYDLRFTIAHEIGHAIGLDHPGKTAGLMGYRYDERYRELQAGDIAGAVKLYGRRRALASHASPDSGE